jgi:hypothetical protein
VESRGVDCSPVNRDRGGRTSAVFLQSRLKSVGQVLRMPCLVSVDGGLRVRTFIRVKWGCLIDTATARPACVAWWMWKEKKKSVTS